MQYDSKEILKPKSLIQVGINLPHRKNTAEMEPKPIDMPKTVTIPLKQNIGAACDCLVEVGARVKAGTKIGDSENNFSSPIYSSVSGTVTAITTIPDSFGGAVSAIVIEADSETEYEEFTPPVIECAEDLIKAARDCGLVGLGGAGFPAHIKLAGALTGNIDTLIINAAECEPYITSDYRTCMDNFQDVCDGVYLLKKTLAIRNVIIAIENNKPDAIKKLYEVVTDHKDKNNTVKLMRLKSAYPQGAEKVLVYNATKRKIPLGKLPSDVGCIVMNITSVAVLNNFIRTGEPLISKCITVDGDAVHNPQNLIVPIGIAVEDVLNYCGYDAENTEKILYGGPMMGVAIKDTSAVITKQNNALLAFKADNRPSSTPCIRCGKCASVCPMNLTPAKVETAVNRNNKEALQSLNINYCIECGSCSFTCPAYRPLTQSMRLAKAVLRRENNAK